MRRFPGVLITAVLGAAFALPALAATARPTVITQPDWITKPGAKDLSEHYPKPAALLSIEGRTLLTCHIDAFGALLDCRPWSESPSGMGFGAAAVAMAPLFRMRPMTRDGQPVAGGRVSIPIVFRMLQRIAPPPLPAVSPQALALAKRFAAQVKAEDNTAEIFNARADEIDFTDDDGTPPATRSAVANALRGAANANVRSYVEDNATAFASVLSVAELQDIASFAETAAGVMLRPNPDFDAIVEMLQRDMPRRVHSDAGPAFCRSHDCRLEPVLAAPVSATIAAPVWVENPDLGEIEAAKPAILRALGLPGAARLVCKIDVLARPAGCTVAAEAPAGIGVGSAAAALAGDLRLSPTLMSQGAQSETVAITIVFDGPEPQDPFHPPQPRSAKALALAHQLAKLKPVGGLAPQDEANLKFLLDTPPPGSDPATLAAAVQTVRDAAAQALAAFQAGVEATEAALYSEQDLTAYLAFQRTAGGRALIDKHPQLEAATRAAASRSYEKILADARAVFCKDRPCEPGPPTASALQISPAPRGGFGRTSDSAH